AELSFQQLDTLTQALTLDPTLLQNSQYFQAQENLLTKVKDALKAMDSEANHDPRLQWDIARIYDMLAVIRGSGGTGMGDRASAVANAQKAREIMERLVPLDPHNEAKAVTLASAYGHVADNTSDPAAAIDTCRRMLQLVQQRISGQNFIGMT